MGGRERTGCRCSVESTPTAENERVVSVTAAASEGMVAGVGAVLECLLNSPRYDNDDDDDDHETNMTSTSSTTMMMIAC